MTLLKDVISWNIKTIYVDFHSDIVISKSNGFCKIKKMFFRYLNASSLTRMLATVEITTPTTQKLSLRVWAQPSLIWGPMLTNDKIKVWIPQPGLTRKY